MKFGRIFILLSCFVVGLTIIGVEGTSAKLILKRKRRTLGLDFGLFSKPPKKEDDEEETPNIFTHIGNAMKGGTIGIHKEFSPLAPVHHMINHAKQFAHGVRDTFIKPHLSKNIPNYERPSGGKEEETHESWELKDPKRPQPDGPRWEDIGEKSHDDWEPKDPKKPQPDGPRWEDIGEKPEDDDIPYEDIINPRRRPKRYIESKIYHVPVLFRSNAKPYEVKVKRVNDIHNW